MFFLESALISGAVVLLYDVFDGTFVLGLVVVIGSTAGNVCWLSVISMKLRPA